MELRSGAVFVRVAPEYRTRHARARRSPGGSCESDELFSLTSAGTLIRTFELKWSAIVVVIRIWRRRSCRAAK